MIGAAVMEAFEISDYTPIINAVSEYAARNNIRMHTPGHAGGGDLPPWLADFARYDVTELPGLDSLYEASGIIANSERLAAELFGAGETLFSAGGNTLCIQAMLSVLPRGSRVLMPRAAVHRSAINAAALLGLEPVFMPMTDGNMVDLQVMDELLISQKPSAVYVTSPDYYGRMADIAAIAKLAERHGALLLVDNAHGSHLKFLRPDEHPITLGAHMSADSAHKTLGVLTGGAMLHISKKYRPPCPMRPRPVKELMSVFGSTSPSYPILMSLEYACAVLRGRGGEMYAALAEKAAAFRKKAMEYGFRLIDGKIDPIRITLSGKALGFTGHKLFDELMRRGLTPEWADEAWCVLLPSVFSGPREFERAEEILLGATLGAMQGAVRPAAVAMNGGDVRGEQPKAAHIPARRMPLAKAMFAGSCEVPVSEALGRISGQTVSVCPPGTPIIVAGEEIDEISQALLINSRIFSIKVV